MSGKIKNVQGPFTIYHLVKENYIGITSNLKRRVYEHKYNKSWKCEIVNTLAIINNFDEAIAMENKFQIQFNCPVSKVKNQNGINNPMSAMIKHIPTGKIYKTIKEAAEDLGLNYGSIRNQKYKQSKQLINIK